jgi:L-ascorbate metabolism protein UlaG (beta-lactamase superfamily)
MAATAQPPVSTSMPLDEIAAAMEAYPPRWEYGDQRAAIMASLDRIVDVRVWKELTDEGREELKILHDFYLKRMDRGLDKLETTRVTEGVHAFKFYSSSYVFKTPAATVAMDFCQGPINNGGEPETRDEYRSGFYWTPAQRDRLARMVDAMIVTHRHHDHADYSLARRLVEQGKPVIGPAQLKEAWKDLAHGITVPVYGTAQTIGPVRIVTMLGAQFSTSRPTGNGTEREGIPTLSNPSADSETVAYLFQLNGVTFLQAAENHVPAGEWFRDALAQGVRPDVRLSLGQYQGERSLLAELKSLPTLFRLPLHEYELTHENGGNRTGSLLTGGNRTSFNKRLLMPLLWGEDFLLTRDLLPAR